MGQRWKTGDKFEGHCSNAGKRYGGLNLDIGSGSGEKWPGSEYSLQVDVIEFAVGLEVRYKRKKEVKVGTSINRDGGNGENLVQFYINYGKF